MMLLVQVIRSVVGPGYAPILRLCETGLNKMVFKLQMNVSNDSNLVDLV